MPESFFGDTKTDCVPSCDAYGTNAQNFDTSKTYLCSGRAFDAPSTVAQVQFPFWETQGGLIVLRLNTPRHELAPLFGELFCLKADHPYRGRESCHLKYINSLISRVVVAGIGLRGRTYTCYQRRDCHIVSAVVGRTDSRGARISG